MKRDRHIFQLIETEYRRQLKGIELIASENFVSNEVMQAMGSVLTNKYAEGYPGKRYYGGCEVVDIVEDIARERLKELYDAEWKPMGKPGWADANWQIQERTLNPGQGFWLQTLGDCKVKFKSPL